MAAILLVLVGTAVIAGAASAQTPEARGFDALGWVLAVGITPLDAAGGDFDGDGAGDLAWMVNGPAGGSVTLRYGPLDSRFAPVVHVPLPTAAFRIACFGDLTGDGIDDLVVRRVDAGGTTERIEFWSIGPSRSVQVVGPSLSQVGNETDLDGGDIDGDGDIDLAVGQGKIVEIWLNDGVAGFTLASSFQDGTGWTAGGGSRGLLLDDYDGDGKLDLAHGQLFYSVILDRGRGDGTFELNWVVQGFGLSRRFVRCDYNNDGRNDLVGEPIGGPGQIELLAPSVQDFRAVSLLSGVVHGVHAFDADGDAFTDLLFTDTTATASDLTILRGAANWSETTPFIRPLGPSSARIERVDFDGHLDLDPLILGTAATALTVFMQGPSHGIKTNLSTVGDPAGLSLGDIDGDGRLDIATFGRDAGTIGIHLSQPSGDTWQRTDVLLPGNRFSDLLVLDVDADGRADLITTDRFGNKLAIRRSLPGGGFDAPLEFAVPSARLVAAGDVDGDLDLDLVVVHTAGDGPGVRLFLATGGGSFVPGPTVIHFQISEPKGVLLTDLTRDGRVDIVLSSAPGVLAFPQLAGEAGFGEGQFVSSGGTGGLDLLDAEHDGDLDLVLARVGAAGPRMLAMGPSGPLGESEVGISPMSRDVWAGDLDGDGNADLAVLNSAARPVSAGSVTLFEGRGDGTFRFAMGYLTERNPSEIVAGDVTGDGRPDLVFTNEGSLSVTVMTNRMSGSPVGVPSPPVPGPGRLVLRAVPNPVLDARGRVHLDGTPGTDIILQVVGVDGRHVTPPRVERIGETGRLTVDLARGARLVPGVYYILARQGGATAHTRIVVLR